MTYRNKRILRLAKDCPQCAGCGCGNMGNIVAAHANSSIWGKSMGKKAHDFAIAYLCFDCHQWLDESGASKEDKEAFWLRAHVKTMEWLFENHLEVK